MGVGIIFISIIFLATITIFLNSQSPSYSKDEIIERAEELGMAFPQNEPYEQEYQPQPAPEVHPEPPDYTSEPEEIIEYYEYDQYIGQPEQLVAREDIVVQISYGMPAIFISQMLFEKNIIDDVVNFSDYLVAAGFSNRLRAGFLTFTTNSTFREATSVLIGRDMFPHEIPFQ